LSVALSFEVTVSVDAGLPQTQKQLTTDNWQLTTRKGNPMNTLTEFYGEPISIYTDADALQDGTLIDVSDLDVQFQGMPISRFTRAVWFDWRKEFQCDELTLPKNALQQHLRAKLQAALQAAVYKGDIWTLPERLWLIENEVAGWTRMYPSDY
jgi:hypothetical protein